jgi:hypothetical protein
MSRRYEDEEILVDLPDPWALVPVTRPDFLVFEDRAARRQLSVSIFHVDSSQEGVAAAVKKLFELRLDVERRQLGPDDPLVVDSIQSPVGELGWFFSGVDGATGRVFSGVATWRAQVLRSHTWRASLIPLPSMPRSRHAFWQEY